MVLFAHDVKKIKGTAQRNGDVDGTCKRSITDKMHQGSYFWNMFCNYYKKMINIFMLKSYSESLLLVAR